MPKVITCECGVVCEGADDAAVLDVAERHVQEHHPDLVGRISREDLLAMAETVEA